ncbi:toll/interleukin-1 receptor domain-containing protein [Actinacidiphila acididurans]|uniref:Toll/interleukin-1 receptor domain-containing protein n=1 Tax=Actinacidiphila acididurans TaxID=2784346 RepID=A0ABS2U439_9ACTN|nr:toll/interleukin-1 receptor domain-containing protein [Actinacidiphila acididurans]MBM9510378.1 toll/interleukin-1 receptor domain-containing protein [Actinacidiphila acididurans]
MAEIFINYRTGDGDRTAAAIERELAHRFGEDKVFRASRSIRPGERFPQRLVEAVRRSTVVLTVAGASWSRSRKLHDEDDWVRREIVEALACGIPVIPVLDGRDVQRFSTDDLPPELADLAEVQSLRFDVHNGNADFTRIGDELAQLVPSLRAADRTAPRRPAHEAGVANTMGDVHGPGTQGRDFTGDVGTVIKNPSGNVHTGTGDINAQRYSGNHYSGNSQHSAGDGAINVSGDISGGIGQHFGGPRRRPEDEDEQ